MVAFDGEDVAQTFFEQVGAPQLRVGLGDPVEFVALVFAWARRSRLPAFIDLHRKITAHRAAIDATLEHRLSQGLIESTNTKIRLLTRIAFGFHGHQPLIALAMLALGSYPPRLPDR